MSRRNQLTVRNEDAGFFRVFQRNAFLARVTPADYPEAVRQLDLREPETSTRIYNLLALAFYRAFEGQDASKIEQPERRERAGRALENFTQALPGLFEPAPEPVPIPVRNL